MSGQYAINFAARWPQRVGAAASIYGVRLVTARARAARASMAPARGLDVEPFDFSRRRGDGERPQSDTAGNRLTSSCQPDSGTFAEVCAEEVGAFFTDDILSILRLRQSAAR